MVNANDAQRRALSVSGQLDGHSRLIEGGGDVVDGDRVVRVGAVWNLLLVIPVNTIGYGNNLRVGANVADNGESTLGRRQGLDVNEGWDRRAQVDAAGGKC